MENKKNRGKANKSGSKKQQQQKQPSSEINDGASTSNTATRLLQNIRQILVPSVSTPTVPVSSRNVIRPLQQNRQNIPPVSTSTSTSHASTVSSSNVVRPLQQNRQTIPSTASTPTPTVPVSTRNVIQPLQQNLQNIPPVSTSTSTPHVSTVSLAPTAGMVTGALTTTVPSSRAFRVTGSSTTTVTRPLVTSVRVSSHGTSTTTAFDCNTDGGEQLFFPEYD